jgi:hypothetical protein
MYCTLFTSRDITSNWASIKLTIFCILNYFIFRYIFDGFDHLVLTQLKQSKIFFLQVGLRITLFLVDIEPIKTVHGCLFLNSVP